MTTIKRKASHLCYALERVDLASGAVVVCCGCCQSEIPSSSASTVQAGPGFMLAITPATYGAGCENERGYEAGRRIMHKAHSANVPGRAAFSGGCG